MLRWRLVQEEQQSSIAEELDDHVFETESAAEERLDDQVVETESASEENPDDQVFETIKVDLEDEERVNNMVSKRSKTKTTSWVLDEPYESKWWLKPNQRTQKRRARRARRARNRRVDQEEKNVKKEWRTCKKIKPSTAAHIKYSKGLLN